MTLPSTLPLSMLVVGGSPDLRASLRGLLRNSPRFCLVLEAETGAAALDLVFRCQPTMAFVDICLPDRNGFEVLKCLRQLAPACVTVILSNAPDPCVEEVARLLGAHEVWHKGNDLSQLRNTLRRLIPGILDGPISDTTFRSLVS